MIRNIIISLLAVSVIVNGALVWDSLAQKKDISTCAKALLKLNTRLEDNEALSLEALEFTVSIHNQLNKNILPQIDRRLKTLEKEYEGRSF